MFLCPSIPMSLFLCPYVTVFLCPSILQLQDYFDISLVDGFNLPMVISVVTPYPWPQGNEVGN